MEEKIAFENFLYNDDKEIIINDMEFFVNRIVQLPKFRPHKLEMAVKLYVEYCQRSDFRQIILEKSNECPVLIYKLYQRGIFEFNEIEPVLMRRDVFLLCFYFYKKIADFKKYIRRKHIPYLFDESLLENLDNLDVLFEYGFKPSSVEYSLKYDDIDGLDSFSISTLEAQWSPFEWSIKPQYLDLLSFSGFFGSIKCFKRLLMKGFEINEKVVLMVVCSGSLDLFHLCQVEASFTKECVCKASEFCHLSLLVFMSEIGVSLNEKDEYDNTPLHLAAQNGHLSVVEYLYNQKADINEKDSHVEMFCLMILLFIWLLKMVILV